MARNLGRGDGCVTILPVRLLPAPPALADRRRPRQSIRRQAGVLVTLLMLAVPLAAHAADALADARRLYNQGQYDAAERLARDAVKVAGSADGARVVLGRIQLERFRRSA